MTDKEPNVHTKRRNQPEEFGYSYYPERSLQKGNAETPKSWWSKLSDGRKAGKLQDCPSNVKWCLQNNSLVKLLVSALEKNGCKIIPERHISCEECLPKVNGGFDPTNNQIVVCKNTSGERRVCCSVLTHELIHMFDSCRAKLDFKNIDHLACTEVRAASIMHCRFLTAMAEGDASPINFKNKHRDCARKKALMSVLMVRNVTMEDAEAAVDRVFEKCYRDKEPFGRVPRSGSTDPEKIYVEARNYGYCD